MRKPALIALLAVALVGVIVVAFVGARDSRTLAFTLGVPPGAPVVTMRPGRTVCQGPIDTVAAFDAIELQPGTFELPGQPLELVVRRADGQQLARGQVAAGYRDFQPLTVPVGEVPQDDGRIEVCVTNDGTRRVALYGAADAAARGTTASLDGRPTGVDLDLVFRTESRSTVALVPDMLDRMALFRGGWIGPWLYWLLLVAVVIGAPALLWRALSGALDDESDTARDSERR